LGFTDRKLDPQPSFKFVLIRPEFTHFGQSIALDHSLGLENNRPILLVMVFRSCDFSINIHKDIHPNP